MGNAFAESGMPPQWSNYYPHPVQNMTSEEIPAYGVMRVSGCTSAGDRTIYEVSKPNGSATLHFLNGPVAIAANGYGIATNRFPSLAAYSGTPAYGEEWGPVNNSWLIETGGSGLFIVGGAASGYVRVADKLAANSEPLRIARALVDEASHVSAAATTFQVDNVVPEGSSLDPVAGNMATELTVSKGGANGLKESLRDNQPVYIFYNGTNWELLLSERPRRIRGKAVGAYGASGTFPIDDIEVLESGTDPRTDTTSATEQVTVTNVPTNSYADNARVDAAWNASDGIWEALPVAQDGEDGASGMFICTLASPLAAGTLASPTQTNVTVYSIGENFATASEGTRAVGNHLPWSLPAGDYYCAKTWDDPIDASSDEFTILGRGPTPTSIALDINSGNLRVQLTLSSGTVLSGTLALTCSSLVSAVNCVDGEIVETTVNRYTLGTCTP
jgi:hypothetical protein